MRSKKKNYARQSAWKKRNPWARHVEHARRRCTDSRHKDYANYGGRGVSVDMTAKDARVLWERDGAAAMREPSLDRIDRDLGYTPANCRFIEKSLNERLPHDAALRDEATPSWVTEDCFA